MKTLLASLLFLIATAAVPVTVTLTGCDDIDQAFDCAQICQRYEDCIDQDYDVDACTDRCEDNADESDDFADQADACENCLDDRSCAGSFPCIDECVGVVP
jgi:hypothetical protein